MKKFTFSIIIILLNSSLIFAQITHPKKCGTEIVHQIRLLNEPGYAESYAKLQQFVKEFEINHPNGYSPKAVITIPVVFHIVLSPAENASFPDTRCIENIATLNADFAGLNTHQMGAFSSTLKANCEIQFCLATVSPTGSATNGIERINYTGAQWNVGNNNLKLSSAGGLDAWNPTQYLNIWICNLEDGQVNYSVNPASLNNFYGLVNDYEYTGTTGASAPYDLGGTVTHGIGHCFNLPHIWGDAGSCIIDDGFGDTPTQFDAIYGAPTGVLFDACQPTSPGIMYMNFMDYTDDLVYSNFTPNQKTAMLALFSPGGILEPLTTSNKCTIPQNADSVYADFRASTNRLIVASQNVNYEDLSIGNISSWHWQFQAGTPSSSTIQNPSNIVYSTPGMYDVTLIVSNGVHSDTLCKQNYIIVTTELWPDPNGFCDTISNRALNETPLTFVHLTPSTWGYLPGHNGSLIKAYADKYVNYTFSEISGLLVPVAKAYASSGSSKVRFKIWSGNNFPETELGYKDVYINNMNPGLFYPATFNPPIPVNGTFFCGYELCYSAPQDTFTCYMVSDRGVSGLNTMFVKESNDTWETCDDLYNIHTSLGIKVIGCLVNNIVNSEPDNTESEIKVYPLPSGSSINIDFSGISVNNNLELKVFDLLGNELTIPKTKLTENLFKIDFSHQTSGIYFVIIKNGTQLYKTKVPIIH